MEATPTITYGPADVNHCTVTSKAVLHVACRVSNKDDDDTENILVCFVQDQNRTLGDSCWNPPECTGCDGT